MEILFTPKKDFIRETAAREAHAQIVGNPLVHRTIAIAIAEMVSRGLSPTDLAGINGFLYTWLNLSEEAPAIRPLPTKHLTSFGQPGEVAKTSEA